MVIMLLLFSSFPLFLILFLSYYFLSIYLSFAIFSDRREFKDGWVGPVVWVVPVAFLRVLCCIFPVSWLFY